MAGLTIGDTLPNLEVESTHGMFNLHDYAADNWTIIVSHSDFDPVSTTELGKIAGYADEFEKRGVKLLGLSCDDLQSHSDWMKDIEAVTAGCKVNFPIITDSNRVIIKQLNAEDPDYRDAKGKHLPSRALHIVGPDKKVKLSFVYPSTTGRNIDEVVRVVDSLQKAAKHKVATPANWKPGEAVVISPAVSNDQANQIFPRGFQTAHLPSNKQYLRFTAV